MDDINEIRDQLSALMGGAAWPFDVLPTWPEKGGIVSINAKLEYLYEAVKELESEYKLNKELNKELDKELDKELPKVSAY